MRTILAIALVALGLVVPALAQEKQQPVKITAENFVVNEETREAVFTGTVVVTHPSVTLYAPMVTIIYGEGGTSDVKSFVASGPVRLKTADQSATGDQAEFEPGPQILRLSGNVKVTNAGGTVRGASLVVDLARGTSTFTAGAGERVTGVFGQ